MSQDLRLASTAEIAEAPPNLLAVIARAAADERVDTEKMAALLGLQERVEERQAQRLFNEALIRLQARLPRIAKTGQITNRDNKVMSQYAKFEDIDRAVRPLLNEEGFAFLFGAKVHPTDKEKILVTAELRHAGGHMEKQEMPVALDSSGAKNSTQGAGSSLSYGKRYLMTAMLNIVTEGEDTDGNNLAPLDPDQLNKILDLLLAMDQVAPQGRARFLAFANVNDPAEILQKDFGRHLSALTEGLRKAREAKEKAKPGGTRG